MTAPSSGAAQLKLSGLTVAAKGGHQKMVSKKNQFPFNGTNSPFADIYSRFAYHFQKSRFKETPLGIPINRLAHEKVSDYRITLSLLGLLSHSDSNYVDGLL
jgi:hypothetical protein